MRNAMAYAGKTQCRVVSAWVGTAFAQDDAEAAQAMATGGRSVAAACVQAGRTDGQRRSCCPGLYELPTQHRAKIHSTNPLERLNGEIKRRSDVVGIL